MAANKNVVRLDQISLFSIVVGGAVSSSMVFEWSSMCLGRWGSGLVAVVVVVRNTHRATSRLQRRDHPLRGLRGEEGRDRLSMCYYATSVSSTHWWDQRIRSVFDLFDY